MALISSEVATTQEIYRIVADNSSVISVFQALVSNCSVTNSSDISPYYPSNNTWPVPEQVVQYYRASSFALSLDSYNNTAALASNAPVTNTSTPKSVPVSPLPNSINNTFLVCLNTTVGASIPLVDPISKDDLYEIIGAAAFVGIIVLIILYNYCVDKADSTDEDVEDDAGQLESDPGLIHRGVVCLRNFFVGVQNKSTQMEVASEADRTRVVRALVGVVKGCAQNPSSPMLRPAAEALKWLLEHGVEIAV